MVGNTNGMRAKRLTNGSHTWVGIGGAISTSQVLIAFAINEDTAPTASSITNMSGSLTTVGNATSVTLDTTRTSAEDIVFILEGTFTQGRAYFCRVNFTKA